MKKISCLFTLVFGLFIVFGNGSCTKTNEITVDTALPQGSFIASKSGSIIAQNATGSKGTVQLGKDSEGTNFVKFGADFSTVLATGTVTVYLSTSNTFKADPAKGNPDLKLLGIISQNGEMYIKLAATAEAKFTHLILWCGSANIPFGNAELK